LDFLEFQRGVWNLGLHSKKTLGSFESTRVPETAGDHCTLRLLIISAKQQRTPMLFWNLGINSKNTFDIPNIPKKQNKSSL
jgi:hypothetical protein